MTDTFRARERFARAVPTILVGRVEEVPYRVTLVLIYYGACLHAGDLVRSVASERR
jgi:hypothetical protein